MPSLFLCLSAHFLAIACFSGSWVLPVSAVVLASDEDSKQGSFHPPGPRDQRLKKLRNAAYLPLEVEKIVPRLLENVTNALGACQDPSTVDWQQLDAAREGLANELTSLVKLARRHSSSEVDHVDIDTFGSLRSGLADGRSSDLDVSVMYGGNRDDVGKEQAKQYADELKQQLKVLDPQNTKFRVSGVLEARVPLVTLEFFVDENSTTEGTSSVFKIELSFSSRAPIRNTIWLRWQVQRDPRFRPLALAVKEFANRIGLHGTFLAPSNGESEPEKTVGLSSYAWSLLVAFFLHMHPLTGEHPSTGEETLLADFRRYYATFDYKKHIISFPGASALSSTSSSNGEHQMIVASISEPVARHRWWTTSSVSRRFHLNNPVLLDPFEENRNLFQYFSDARNLKILEEKVVGDFRRRVSRPGPEAVHVFPWKLGTERIHLNCNGCDEEIDFELWGKSTTHPADDPLLRLKLRVFEACNKMFFDDNGIVAGGGTVLQNVEDIVLAGGLYRDNARNRRGLPVTVVSVPMENRRERIMEISSEKGKKAERKRIIENVVRLIKGIRLILPLMMINQTTNSCSSTSAPISSGGGRGADREEVTRVAEGSFKVGEVVEYNSVTYTRWMRTIVVGFPEDDPGHIHLSMRSSADRKRVRPLHGYSRETGGWGRDVVPWVVRMLSDTLVLLPKLYGKHLSTQQSGSVLSEAVSAVKAVFDAGFVGANSVAAEFVVDRVTRTLTDLPAVPVVSIFDRKTMVSLLGMLARPGDVKVVAALAREFLRCGRQWYYSPRGGKCPDNLISALTKVVGPPNPSMLGLLDRDATQQNLVQLKNLIQEMLAGMHIYEEPPKHGPKDGSYMYRNYRETPGELWELCDKLGCNLSSLEERMRSELRQWAEKTINAAPLHPDRKPRAMESGKTLTEYVDVILGAARDLYALRFSSRWIHMVGGEQEQPKNDALELLKKLKKNFQDNQKAYGPKWRENEMKQSWDEASFTYPRIFDRGLKEINSILLSAEGNTLSMFLEHGSNESMGRFLGHGSNEGVVSWGWQWPSSWGAPWWYGNHAANAYEIV